MKTKRLKTLRTVLALAVIVLCAAAFTFVDASSGESSAALQEELTYGELRYVVNSGTVTIRGCSTEAVSVVIPETIDGMQVTELGYQAFRNCKSLTSVVIPAGMTKVATGGAFYGCDSLTSAGPVGGDYAIQFGWTGSIPAYAFADCSGLKKAVIPDTVTEIGERAFFCCGSLAEVIIPAGVNKVGDGAFYGCDCLTSAGPTGGDYCLQFGWTETLPSKAFSDLKNLQLLVIPAQARWQYFLTNQTLLKTAGPAGGDYDIQLGQMETIPAQMFKGSHLESVVLPSSVTTLEDNAFSGSKSLKTVTFSDKLSSIGSCAFDGCESLAGKLTVPDSVTAIGTYAFRGCGSLEEVELPSGITALESGTFSKCSSLRSIVIPDGVTELGKGSGYVFEYCSNLESVLIPASCTKFNYSTFRGCEKLRSAGPVGGNYNIQFGWTESLPANAFQDCAALELVVIPASVTSILNGVFRGCTGLKTAGPAGGDYNIQFSWEDSIPRNAFSACTALEEVTIPASVTSLGDSAFNNCPALRSVHGGEGLQKIDRNAFSNCKALESIDLPACFSDLGSGAFTNCSALAAVNIDAANETYVSVEGVVFSRDMKELILCPPGFGSGEYRIPDGVVTVKENSFAGNQRITEISMPGSVRTVKFSAFSGCAALKRVTVPDSVTSLENGAFRDCKALEEAVLSANLKRFTGNEFNGCPNVTIKSCERTWAEIYAMDNGIPWESLGECEVNEIYVTESIDWNTLSNHTRVILADGTYNCWGTYTLCDITVEAEHPGRAELLSVSGMSPVLSFNQSAYVDLKGLIMGHESADASGSNMCGASVSAYSNESAAHVLVCTWSRFVTVDSCDLWGCGLTSVFLWQTQDVTVKDSVLRDCVFGAVYCSSSSGVFENCIISGNAYHEEYRTQPCIYIKYEYKSEDYPTEVSFINCEFFGNYNPKLAGGQITVNYRAVEWDSGRYFTDCVFHDNAWDGYTPGMCGVCAVDRVTWQIVEGADGKKTLVTGKDIAFGDGGTYESGHGETPLYSRYSLPWVRYLGGISSYVLVPGTNTLLPSGKDVSVALDLAAAGVPAGGYTLVRAVFSDINEKNGGQMDSAVMEEVTFDGVTPIRIAADGNAAQTAVFMLLGGDGSVPACGRTSLGFTYVRQ